LGIALETELVFSSFLAAALRGPGALRGPVETGAGRLRRLLVPILLNGGFGYEDKLRLRSPLAVDHRI